MAYIGNKPTVGNFQICDAISVVNGQAAYTMQVGSVNVTPQSANHMIVSLNGVIQKPNSSFTVSGSTITFSSNLATGDVIDFIQILGNVLDLGVPSDGTVTTAKVVDGAITSAKLASGAGFNPDAAVVFNESGADVDFRVESDEKTHAIFLQGSDGKVGIDTSAPSAKFNVSNGGASGIELEPEIATNTNRITNYNRSGSAYNIFRLDALQQEFYISGSEKMRIDSSGRLLLNRTSTNENCEMNIFHDSWGLILDSVSNSGTKYHLMFSRAGGTIGSITSSSSAVSYNTTSDYRLKENVSYDFDATTRIKQLKPARFNFIADADTTVDGFIAHEVSSIVPEAITGNKDAVKEDGTPDYQGIDQSKLVPLLVKTIQELEARITELENA